MNPQTKYSEQELVYLLQQQNETAFNYLYDNYSGALYGVICPIVKDAETASDILQEVFVNIWKKMNQYDASKGRLFTWMMNIARNAAIDKIRSRSYQDGMKNRPIPEHSEITGISTDAKTTDVGLKKIITKLKEDYRVLIDLSYFQGFTHEEISRIMDIPLGTVKTRIRSALLQLRTMLQ